MKCLLKYLLSVQSKSRGWDISQGSESLVSMVGDKTAGSKGKDDMEMDTVQAEHSRTKLVYGLTQGWVGEDHIWMSLSGGLSRPGW